MPKRRLVSKELSDLFGVLGNPDRIRIIEELRNGEVDVNGLQQALDVPQSRISQHLAVLRAHRIVSERRNGRHVYYHLQQPALAAWILQGLDFSGGELGFGEHMREAIEEVRSLWSSAPEPETEEALG
jgi:DNA-binding transcriptional ArsR family regulator